MVMISRKKQNGKYYYYLEERARVNGKSTRLWQKYLGTEEKIKNMTISLAPEKLDYKTMSFGSSSALLQIANKIGFIETIDSITNKNRDQNLSVGEYLLIATINRCISPVSKSKLATWFKNDYISTVFQIDSEILNSQTYWNHFQYLGEEEIAQIETRLIKNVIKEYDLDLSTLLFDPTNFFTFIEEKENGELAQFGHSKENRNNLRIINLSLICTLQFGVPIFHQTYEGNVQDAKHFKGVINKIISRFQDMNQKIEEIVLLFDKGNHSDEAFKDITASNLFFIASLRNSTQQDLLNIDKSEFTTIKLPSNNKEVGYYQTTREIYGVERIVYVLYDRQKQKRSIHKFEFKLSKKLDQIQEKISKLNVKKWRSKENVEQKLNSIIGKKPFSNILSFSISGPYSKLKVIIHLNGENLQIHYDSLGISIIFTNLNDWDPIKIIQAFRDKYVVEDAFKKLKNPYLIAIRPMYHWSDTCIRAHVFSCILSLLLLSLLRKELNQKKLQLSYEEMLEHLSELDLTMIYTSKKSAPIYKLNRHSPLSAKIYKILKLKSFLPQ